MEQKIKNFDRRIEQMMNETAANPPFGMWNRIANELEPEVAAPVAAPSSFIPKPKAVVAIAGVLLIGASLITAYLVSNKPIVQKQVTVQPQPVVSKMETKVVEPVVVKAEPQMPVFASVAKKKVTAEPVAEKITVVEVPVVESYHSNMEVAVPEQTTAQNMSASADPYYFPPVDVPSREAEKNNVATASADKKLSKPVADDDDDKASDKKNKSSHEKKLRPKKRRGGGFTYGRINRFREPK